MNFYLGGAPITLGQQQEQLRSSPLTLKGSEVKNLREYLAWLVEKGHLSDEHGRQAQLSLSQSGWGFQQLRQVEKTEWQEMGIPRGAQLIILGKQKEWITVTTRKAVEDETRRQIREEDSPLKLLSD